MHQVKHISLILTMCFLVSGCASKPKTVDAGVGSKTIYLTKNDQIVISDGLITQLLAHNTWCDGQEKCQKLNPKTGKWEPEIIKP